MYDLRTCTHVRARPRERVCGFFSCEMPLSSVDGTLTFARPRDFVSDIRLLLAELWQALTGV